MKPEVVDKAKYEKVLSEARSKFERFPSIYASSWIVREYKKRGGRYKGEKTSKSGLNRWFTEEWVQVEAFLKTGKKIECGARNKDGKACRPLERVNERTPSTVAELLKIHSKEKLLRLAKLKEKDMKGRVNWKAGIFKGST